MLKMGAFFDGLYPFDSYCTFQNNNPAKQKCLYFVLFDPVMLVEIERAREGVLLSL